MILLIMIVVDICKFVCVETDFNTNKTRLVDCI